ncbi:MAG: hypothetical protein JRI31_01715 [Deltaproteobacteria bacterium]|nr:hypothetical protein [Deltaproteobacteria bacterium]
MAISLDSLYGKLASSLQAQENQLADHIANMDPNNTQDMLKLQMLTQKWTMVTNLTTNMMNTLKEATKNVIQNIR